MNFRRKIEEAWARRRGPSSERADELAAAAASLSPYQHSGIARPQWAPLPAGPNGAGPMAPRVLQDVESMMQGVPLNPAVNPWAALPHPFGPRIDGFDGIRRGDSSGVGSGLADPWADNTGAGNAGAGNAGSGVLDLISAAASLPPYQPSPAARPEWAAPAARPPVPQPPRTLIDVESLASVPLAHQPAQLQRGVGMAHGVASNPSVDPRLTASLLDSAAVPAVPSRTVVDLGGVNRIGDWAPPATPGPGRPADGFNVSAGGAGTSTDKGVTAIEKQVAKRGSGLYARVFEGLPEGAQQSMRRLGGLAKGAYRFAPLVGPALGAIDGAQDAGVGGALIGAGSAAAGASAGAAIGGFLLPGIGAIPGAVIGGMVGSGAGSGLTGVAKDLVGAAKGGDTGLGGQVGRFLDPFIDTESEKQERVMYQQMNSPAMLAAMQQRDMERLKLANEQRQSMLMQAYLGGF